MNINPHTIVVGIRLFSSFSAWYKKAMQDGRVTGAEAADLLVIIAEQLVRDGVSVTSSFQIKEN